MEENDSEVTDAGTRNRCGCCFLSVSSIGKLRNDEGRRAIEDVDQSCYHQWSYDLRLGDEAYLSSEKLLTKLGGRQDSLVIQPGEFALLVTFERLNVPLDHVAFISLRFRYALKGLVNISGFHVDPGYSGKIVFSVFNAGPNPVVMRYKDKVFMVVFACLDEKVDRRPESEFSDITRLKADWISAVKGPAVSLTKLNKRVERLTQIVNVLIGVMGSVLAAAIGLFLLRAGAVP